VSRFRLDDVVRERLERIQLDQGGPGRDGVVDDSSLAAEYERLFRSYGVDLGVISPAEAARRLRQGGLPIPLCGALDEWAMLRDGPERSRLLAAAQLADPDPSRGRIRRVLCGEADAASLVEMAGSLDVRLASPETALLLARALIRLDHREVAVDLLWRARSAAPGDFWFNLCLGRSLLKSDRPRAAEAIPYLTAAAALHPESAGAWLTLANAQKRARGRMHAEAAYYQAEAAYREAIRRDPDDDLSRAYLGVVLRSLGRVAEARDVLDVVQPGASESVTALQAHGTLAFELGDFELAERCSRAALAREPGMVLAHTYLGRTLINLGRFSEARDVLLQARNLAGIRDGQARRIEGVLKRCEAFLRQESASGRILSPILYADYLRYKGDYAGATEAYARSLGPARIGEANLSARVRGALTAARAVADAGPDLDPATRDRWLGLALGWLGDAVAAWRGRVGPGPMRDPVGVQSQLEVLRLCGDLRILRDAGASASLPEARRVEAGALWADVAALRGRCEQLKREQIASNRAPVQVRPGRVGRSGDEVRRKARTEWGDDLLESDPAGLGG
jgi:tetratricopeptide (TPR) repeat protein